MNNLIIKKGDIGDWKKYKELKISALKTDPHSFGDSIKEDKDRAKEE